MRQIKCLMLSSAVLLGSTSAYSAGITPSPSEMMAAEIAHEQQVQTQLDKLQKQRDASFLKQLEAETLIEEQRILADGAGASPVAKAP